MTAIFKQPILLYGIVFKLVLLFLFSSQYSSELFYPFLKSLSSENLNPWQLYYEKNLIDSFPYHGLMLVLLAPFAFLGEILGWGESLIKIPLLAADLGFDFNTVNKLIGSNYFDGLNTYNEKYQESFWEK